MVLCSPITNEDENLPTGRALIGGCPSVSKVTPHVEQVKASELASSARLDYLEIRVDCLAQQSQPSVARGGLGGRSEGSSQVTTVAHQREDGVPPSIV
jgi:hypothetical protein